MPVPSIGSGCSSQTFLQGQAPVADAPRARRTRNQQQSGAPVARGVQRGSGDAGRENPRDVSNHWRGAGREDSCGGARVLHQGFAGITHVSPGKRRSVGCDAITTIV